MRGLVLLLAFAWSERRSDHPLLAVKLRRDPIFVAGCVALGLAYFALMGALQLLAPELQGRRGYGPLEAGLALLPMATILVGFAAKKLIGLVGIRVCVVGGFAIVGGGLWIAHEVVDQGYWPLAGALAVVGVGLGAALAAAMTAVLGRLDPERAGVGAGAQQSARIVFGATGVAVLGSVAWTVFSSRIADPLARLGLPQGMSERAEGDLVGALSVAGDLARTDPSAARQLATAAGTAWQSGLQFGLVVAVCAALLGAVAAFWLPGRDAAAAGTKPPGPVKAVLAADGSAVEVDGAQYPVAMMDAKGETRGPTVLIVPGLFTRLNHSRRLALRASQYGRRVVVIELWSGLSLRRGEPISDRTTAVIRGIAGVVVRPGERYEIWGHSAAATAALRIGADGGEQPPDRAVVLAMPGLDTSRLALVFAPLFRKLPPAPGRAVRSAFRHAPGARCRAGARCSRLAALGGPHPRPGIVEGAADRRSCVRGALRAAGARGAFAHRSVLRPRLALTPDERRHDHKRGYQDDRPAGRSQRASERPAPTVDALLKALD